MNNCDKCLENRWAFKNEGLITHADCLVCGATVSWERQRMEKGDMCRKCKIGRIEIKPSPFKQKKLKKAYYYTASFHCPNCNVNYYSDLFKVNN